MKKIFLLIVILYTFNGYSQNSANLDINNVKAGINAAGDLFYDINTLAPQLFWPQDSSNNIFFSASNLWIGGLDNASQVRVTAQTYRQGGSQYWAGPLDTTSSSITQTASAIWDKIWKINKSTIDSFKLGLYTSIPASISSWPAHGDPAYFQSHYLAPFYDTDGDGQYSPSNGDYPLIKGDQALYFIFNDNLQGNQASHQLGVEIHGMAYAFNCITPDSSLDNTIFINYKIINRSFQSYLGVYPGQWTDIDMDLYNDNLGSDSLLNLYYLYDGGATAIGVTMLNPVMHSVMGFGNNFSVTGNPNSLSAYYNYLQGKWTDGVPLTYGGSGYGGSSPASFIFSGDPVTPTGWVDTAAASFDLRAIGAAGPFVLGHNDTLTMDIAYVFVREYTSNNIQCVNKLKQRVQSIRNYFSTSTPCGANISGISPQEANPFTVDIFPNPSRDIVTISVFGTDYFDLQIVDMLGREVKRIENLSENISLNKEEMAPGIYYCRILSRENKRSVCKKLLIE